MKIFNASLLATVKQPNEHAQMLPSASLFSFQCELTDFRKSVCRGIETLTGYPGVCIEAALNERSS